MEVKLIRKTFFNLFILIGILLSASCGPAQISPTPQANTPAPTSLPPTQNTTPTLTAQTVINAPLDYCFKYPQGYTLQLNHPQVEVFGPYSGVGGVVAGMVWIDVTDSQGRTAQEIADEEVNAFGGSPLRSTVKLGGEDALVLEGMPGQDLIRKVYIVHNGQLYTLNFMPYQSENATANAQTETLFASVIPSWVWVSSGVPCQAIQ
jgi:hypothetical protein